MIALWKGKNPIYFGVIRSKVKVTVTINRILTTGSFPHDNFLSKIIFIVTVTFDLMTPKYIGFFPFHRGIMWSSLVKIQYTELKLSCGIDGPYYVIGYGGRASTQVSAQ
jgi:hypothetical protein